MLRFAFALLITAVPAFAQSDLVAIDILLQPDTTLVAAAQDWNARLREQTPDGFKLDASHTPHVTLVQAFVAKDDLDAVLGAVGAAAGKLDITGIELDAIGLYHIPDGDLGLQGIVIKPSPDLLAAQEAIIAAVAPFRKTGGGQSAFVPDPSGTPFDPKVFEYVDTFVPKQSGANYNPHVTTGVGPLAWLTAREAEPFKTFSCAAKDIAVYRIGNFGTAAEQLKVF